MNIIIIIYLFDSKLFILLITSQQQNSSTTRAFMTPLVAGDPTPYNFFAYGDQGIDKFPQGQGTAQNVINDIQEDEYRLVFHNGDISYALGYVSRIF